ncbi:hypothetical protein C8F01DRAFT_548465 [Mycena amicta]|nr:hypothetical protein C8F01DRAFT_548465 [Mycena amicta]
MTSAKSESISSSVNAALLREQKAQLEERILQTEMQLKSLKAQRTLVERELSKLVFPVLCLPSELTTRIFALAVATGVAAHDPVLLQLAAVCQQWRAVALDNPVLWQYIAFTTDGRAPEQLFLCFAERSGTLPLYISIRIQGQGPWEIPLGIVNCSPRWKTAHFRAYPGGYGSVSVPSEFSGSLALPLLEELTMNLVRLKWADTGRVMLFSDARCLHKLCFSFPDLVPLVGLPMEQLQMLQFLCPSFDVDLLEVLCHTRNLEILSLSWMYDTHIPFTGAALPIYYKLHTLSCVSGFVPQVIDHLTAPALHTLYLPVMTDAYSASLVAFLIRSGCTIRELSFGSTTKYDALSKLMSSPALASVSQVSLPVQSMSAEEAFEFALLLGNGSFFLALNHSRSLCHGNSVRYASSSRISWVSSTAPSSWMTLDQLPPKVAGMFRESTSSRWTLTLKDYMTEMCGIWSIWARSWVCR